MIRGDFQASAWRDLQRLHQSPLDQCDVIAARTADSSFAIKYPDVGATLRDRLASGTPS
jgi:hypothetical protein